MEQLKKVFTYIKNGKILREQDGLNAKVEKEADDIVDEITGENDRADGTAKSTSGSIDEATALLLDKICEVFRNGPLAFKPNIDKSNSASLETSNGGFDANADGHAKFSIGETKLAAAEYKANMTGRSSVYCENGKEEMTESDNSYEYSSGTSKFEARGELKAESHGYAEAGLLKYKARAEYEADLHLEGKAESSFRKMEKSYHKKEDGFEGQIKVFEAEGRAEGQIRAHGKIEAGVMSRKFKMEGEIEGKSKMEGKFIGMEANGYVRKREIGGSLKVLHAEAKGEASFRGKGSIGNRSVELNANANAEAKIKVIEGKVCLAVKKEKDGSVHIPGAEFTLGQASAKAEAEFELKINTIKNKKGKASAKAKFDGVRVRALGLDAKLEEEPKQDFEAKAELDAKGAEINVLNAQIRGRKKESVSIEAKAKARGVEMNIGNASVTGIDETKTAKVGVKAGAAAVNAGNIQVTGLGRKGVNMEADLTAGVNVGNIAVGFSRETGVTATSRFSFGNVNLTIGPPKLNFGFGGFNIGIPFLSAGGSHGSSGGGGNNKESDSKHNAGGTSCSGGRRSGKDALVGQDGTLTTSGGTFSRDDTNKDKIKNKHTLNNSFTRNDSENNDVTRHHNSAKCDATTRRFGSQQLQREDNSDINDMQSSVPQNRTGSSSRTGRIDNNHTSNSRFTSDGSYNVFAQSQDGTKRDPTSEFGNTRLESVDGKRNVNDVYGSVLQNCTIGPNGTLIPSDENVVIVLEEGNIRGVREVVNHFGLPHSSDTWSETIGYEDDSSFAGHSSSFHVISNMTRSRESGRRTMLQRSHPRSKRPEACANEEETYSFNRFSGGSSDVHSHTRITENETQSSRNILPTGRTVGDATQRGNNINTKTRRHDSGFNKTQTGRRNEVTGFQSNDRVTNSSQHPSPKDAKTTDLRSASAYNKRLKSLVDRKISKESPSVNENNKISSDETDPARLYWTDKDHVKRDLFQKHKQTVGPSGGSGGRKNKGSGSQQIEGSTDWFEDDEHTKPQKKAPPKKPFGEKKNIHTIFTLDSGDTRPVKYIKDNVACFGDD